MGRFDLFIILTINCYFDMCFQVLLPSYIFLQDHVFDHFVQPVSKKNQNSMLRREETRRVYQMGHSLLQFVPGKRIY